MQGDAIALCPDGNCAGPNSVLSNQYFSDIAATPPTVNKKQINKSHSIVHPIVIPINFALERCMFHMPCSIVIRRTRLQGMQYEKTLNFFAVDVNILWNCKLEHFHTWSCCVYFHPAGPKQRPENSGRFEASNISAGSDLALKPT